MLPPSAQHQQQQQQQMGDLAKERKLHFVAYLLGDVQIKMFRKKF